jgi:hypothetical protein
MQTVTPAPEDVEVLAWCNTIRKQLGKPPVDVFTRGLPYNSLECPIARTVGGIRIHGGWFDYDLSNANNPDDCPRTPPCVERFIYNVDNLTKPYVTITDDELRKEQADGTL